MRENADQNNSEYGPFLRSKFCPSLAFGDVKSQNEIFQIMIMLGIVGLQILCLYKIILEVELENQSNFSCFFIVL